MPNENTYDENLAEQGLVVKKLNFFQRSRKMLYLMRMNAKKAGNYSMLPDYLKRDRDVIEAIVGASEELVDMVPIGNARELIMQKPELLKHVKNIDLLSQVLDEKPELLKQVDDITILGQVFSERPALISQYESEENLNNIYNLVGNSSLSGDKKFVKYLSRDLQVKIIEGNFEYRDVLYDDSSWKQSDREFMHGANSKESWEKFSDEAIFTAAIRDKLRKKEQRNPGKNIVTKCDISSRSIELQLKLLLLGREFDSEVSDEAMLRFVNGNPLLFNRMNQRLKERLVEERPELLMKMPLDFQRNYILRQREWSKDRFDGRQINFTEFKSGNFRQNDYQKKYRNLFKASKTGFYIGDYDRPEEAIDKIISIEGGSNIIRDVTDIRNDDYIWEMGKFDPRAVSLICPTFGDLRNIKRNQKLVRNFSEKISQITGQNGVELEKYLRNFLHGGTPMAESLYESKGIEIINRISKLITNEDILRAVPGNEILEYAKNPTNKKLTEIIRKTYGDTSAKILEDRPQMTIELIPNLHIFNPLVIEKFGIGAVHANLSYNMQPQSAILSDFAMNESTRWQYEAFNSQMQDFFPDTAAGLKDKLTAFVKCKNLMRDNRYSRLTEEQKRSLQIALIDSSDMAMPELVSFPKNIEELESYVQRRNEIYDVAIKKEKDVGTVLQLMSKRFFGMDFIGDAGNIRLDSPNVVQMRTFYNLSQFVNNPVTMQGEKFSDEELDALELIDIFSQIRNVDVLVNLAEELSKNERVINPLTFRGLKEKVPMQYNQEMVNALLTPEKAIEMANNGMPGIEVKDADGVKVISLKGVDFKLYVSDPFMSNSGIGSITAEKLAEEWKEKENGISTFSGCVIGQNEATSCVKNGSYGLGFSSISPYQIAGMGITDIHSDHSVRAVSPITTNAASVSYDYPEEFMERYEKRLNEYDPYFDSAHRYNEMLALRREKYLSKIREGTFGGKILADFIFMNGTNTDAAVAQARKCGIQYVFAYDEEKYRTLDRDANRGLETKVSKSDTKTRAETKFMSGIKKIVKENDGNER